jgi:L-lactate dehydrogenase complex protein LldG
MTGREAILTRIREALRVKTLAHATPRLPTPQEHRAVLPPVASGMDGLVHQFERNAAELRATFLLVPDAASLPAVLRRLRDQHGWRRVAAHHGALTNALPHALQLPVLFTDGDFDKNELARCDVGVTECDALVAQTGTVIVTSRSAGGRALSVLPPHHVVLARRSQLVADLPAAMERLREQYADNLPSMISLITGPSRTGDIERILVLGAHGPKQLTILCVSDTDVPGRFNPFLA